MRLGKRRTEPPTEHYEVLLCWGVYLRYVGLSLMLTVTSPMFQYQILTLK
jgi:hypothetical protein